MLMKKIYRFYASWPGAMINIHYLELPLSRTSFHGSKGVRAIEVRLYLYILFTIFKIGGKI